MSALVSTEMHRPRVFVTQPVAASALDRLREVAEVEVQPDPLHIPTQQELIAAAQRSDLIFCLLHDRIDANVLAANPRLKGVVSMTITPADIDTARAASLGIPVTVIPAALLNDATADLAWGLMLSAARRITEGDRLARKGIVPGSQSDYLEGGTITGRVLGIVGMGGVGQAAARRAQGFSMPVIYYDPHRLAGPEEKALKASWVPLDQLLAQSDYVQIHARLTPETRHLISTRELALMKPTAYLINTARGPIVDGKALAVALRSRQIAGAGLDVHETEPHMDPALLALDNIVMTPHLGSAERALRVAMANAAVDNALAIIAGKAPPNRWDPIQKKIRN